MEITIEPMHCQTFKTDEITRAGKRVLRLGLLLITVLPLFSVAVAETSQQKSTEEIIPLTKANIRGHETLYKEGWSVITSTEKALEYAKENAITSSAEALAQMRAELGKDTERFSENITKGFGEGVQTTQSIFAKGTSTSQKLLKGTHEIGVAATGFSLRFYALAWERFSNGYLTYGERTEEDLAELKSIPGDYFTNLQSDFSNIAELSQRMNEALTTDIRADWPQAMSSAKAAFIEKYNDSGHSDNALGGLWHILQGYLSSIYHAIVKPTTQTAIMVGEYTIKTATQAVFLPVSSIAYISGRTIQSTGLTLYYTGKGVVKFVSPTIEGGFFAATATASAAMVPVTYVAGGTAGVVNQVVATAGAPVAGAAEAVIKTTYEAVRYPVVMTYDIAVGSTKVAVNQIKSGVVLGYNAMTAIPAHLLMAIPNSMIFVFWDGPRLVVAYAKGEVIDDDGERHNINELPVGTMLDVDTLRKQEGVIVEEISDDPQMIQQIIKRLPDDLKRE